MGGCGRDPCKPGVTVIKFLRLEGTFFNLMGKTRGWLVPLERKKALGLPLFECSAATCMAG